MDAIIELSAGEDCDGSGRLVDRYDFRYTVYNTSFNSERAFNTFLKGRLSESIFYGNAFVDNLRDSDRDVFIGLPFLSQGLALLFDDGDAIPKISGALEHFGYSSPLGGVEYVDFQQHGSEGFGYFQQGRLVALALNLLAAEPGEHQRIGADHDDGGYAGLAAERPDTDTEPGVELTANDLSSFADESSLGSGPAVQQGLADVDVSPGIQSAGFAEFYDDSTFRPDTSLVAAQNSTMDDDIFPGANHGRLDRAAHLN